MHKNSSNKTHNTASCTNVLLEWADDDGDEKTSAMFCVKWNFNHDKKEHDEVERNTTKLTLQQAKPDDEGIRLAGGSFQWWTKFKFTPLYERENDDREWNWKFSRQLYRKKKHSRGRKAEKRDGEVSTWDTYELKSSELETGKHHHHHHHRAREIDTPNNFLTLKRSRRIDSNNSRRESAKTTLNTTQKKQQRDATWMRYVKSKMKTNVSSYLSKVSEVHTFIFPIVISRALSLLHGMKSPRWHWNLMMRWCGNCAAFHIDVCCMRCKLAEAGPEHNIRV